MERTDGASARLSAKLNVVEVGALTNDDLVFIRSNSEVGRFNSSGDLTITGDYYPTSDVNAKTGFVAVDTQEVLAAVVELPLNTWSYKADESGVRHMGPTAQDFHAAFGIGKDDKHIGTLDSSGVALAAIQGLDEIVAEKEARIKALEEQNDELETRVTALEQVIEALSNPGPPSSSLWPWILAGVLAGALLGVVASALGFAFIVRKRLSNLA
jgi:hypothetical protein